MPTYTMATLESGYSSGGALRICQQCGQRWHMTKRRAVLATLTVVLCAALGVVLLLPSFTLGRRVPPPSSRHGGSIVVGWHGDVSFLLPMLIGSGEIDVAADQVI